MQMGEEPSSTKLIQGAEEGPATTEQVETDFTADYADDMSKKVISKVPGLNQLFVSLNIDKILVNKFMSGDPMLSAMIEKKAVEILKTNI